MNREVSNLSIPSSGQDSGAPPPPLNIAGASNASSLLRSGNFGRHGQNGPSNNGSAGQDSNIRESNHQRDENHSPANQAANAQNVDGQQSQVQENRQGQEQPPFNPGLFQNQPPAQDQQNQGQPPMNPALFQNADPAQAVTSIGDAVLREHAALMIQQAAAGQLGCSPPRKKMRMRPIHNLSESTNPLALFMAHIVDQAQSGDHEGALAFDPKKLITRNKYRTVKSELGLLGKYGADESYNRFVVATFVHELLHRAFPEIVHQIINKLASQPIAGITRENCFKPHYFYPHFVGMPRLIMTLLLEFGVNAMESSGRFSHRDLFVTFVAANRMLDALCLRYSLSVQLFAVQRFGDMLVASKQNTKVLEFLAAAIDEATRNKSMTQGFDLRISPLQHRNSSGSNRSRFSLPQGFNMGFCGGTGGKSSSRGYGHSKGKSRSNGHSGSNSHGTYGPPHGGASGGDFSNPDSPNFIPRGFCRDFHGRKNCSRGENCQYSHLSWSSQELEAAKLRVRNLKNRR